MSDAPGVFSQREILLMRNAYRLALCDTHEIQEDTASGMRPLDDQLAINILREVARGETDIAVLADLAVIALLNQNADVSSDAHVQEWRPMAKPLLNMQTTSRSI